MQFAYYRYRSSQPGLIEEANVGTTAEIYECREPSASSTETGYHIKARGRQRFKGMEELKSVMLLWVSKQLFLLV